MGVEEGRSKKSPHTICIRHMAKKYTTDTLFWHSSMREITASELKYHLYHFGGPSGGASGQGPPPKARRQLLLHMEIYRFPLLNATKNSNVYSLLTPPPAGASWPTPGLFGPSPTAFPCSLCRQTRRFCSGRRGQPRGRRSGGRSLKYKRERKNKIRIKFSCHRKLNLYGNKWPIQICRNSHSEYCYV